jgi:hypothetical protein
MWLPRLAMLAAALVKRMVVLFGLQNGPAIPSRGICNAELIPSIHQAVHRVGRPMDRPRQARGDYG